MSKKNELQEELLQLRLQNTNLCDQLGFLMHGIALADLPLPFEQILSDVVASGSHSEEQAGSIIKNILWNLTPMIQFVRDQRMENKKTEEKSPIIVPEKRIILS